MSVTARPAHALRLRKKKVREDPPHLDVLLDQSWPILKNLGFSGVLGVMAALAFKVSLSSAPIMPDQLAHLAHLMAWKWDRAQPDMWM